MFEIPFLILLKKLGQIGIKCWTTMENYPERTAKVKLNSHIRKYIIYSVNLCTI